MTELDWLGGAGAQMMSSAADSSAVEQKGAQMMSSACERCTSLADLQALLSLKALRRRLLRRVRSLMRCQAYIMRSAR